MNATQEQWRPAFGFGDSYEVSSHGRVRSVDRYVTSRNGVKQFYRGRLLNPYTSTGNYPRVALRRSTGGQQWVRVHTLVLEAFVRPRPEGAVACHNDGDPSNNRVENLRWDTYSENNHDLVRHGTHWHAKKTHCKHGHEFTPANTIRMPDGGRKCRRCQADANARSYRKKKQSGDRQ